MNAGDSRAETSLHDGSTSQRTRTLPLLRGLLFIQSASLLVAAALHAGIVIRGPFEQAAMYEGSLGVILAIALGLTFLAPGSAGLLGLVAQGLTLAGATIGLYLAVLGVAPHTPLDIVYHVALIGLLVVGLGVAWRLRAS